MPIRLRRASAGLLLGLFVLTLTLASVMAVDCEFVLGFKALRDIIGHETVGECLENEHYNANGDSNQKTTGGLLVWRKADNHTAFTDGHHTWVNGPIGLQKRLNSVRYPWEPDYAPGGGVATQTGATGSLPLPPAPSYVGLSNHIDPRPSGNSIRVDVAWPWLDGITTIKISGNLAFSPNSVKREGPHILSTRVNAYLCTPDKAGLEFQYDVAVSALGDGIRYQADWSPIHTYKHTVTCPKETPKPEATPTPDPTLPLAPAHTAGISGRAANWQGKLVEIVVTVEKLPSVGIGWLWRGGSGYTLFQIDGNIHYYHAYVCTAAEAGQSQEYYVELSSYGDGVTYRDSEAEQNKTELTLSVACPTSGAPTTPGPAPGPAPGPTLVLLPTPVPTDGALPLPPVPSASITSELNEAAYNLWSDDRKVMVIKWDYGWPDGVAKLETTGIAGLTTWTAGQTPHKSTEVCWPSEAGRTFTYSVSLRTFGNGVTYRAAWSDWSERVSVTETCPDAPTSAPTASVTPTPTPTPLPNQDALPLPPVPSVSIEYELNETAYNAWSNREVMVIKWDYAWPDGVAKLETNGIAGGTVWTAGQTSSKSTEVCWPYEAGLTVIYSVSLRTFGNGVTYRAAWSDWSETVSVTITCPNSPNAPTPTPTPTPAATVVPGVTPTPTPTPTPLPNQEALPLPPVLSVTGLNHEVIEENLKLWLPNRYLVKITWAYTWPNGIAKIEQDNISPAFDLTTGRRPLMQTVDCYPSDAGRSYRYSFKVRAFGDGVTYRAAWGDWSENATISYTCPNPLPTPTPNVSLPAPPAPSWVSIGSGIDANWHDKLVVFFNFTWPDGISAVRIDGNHPNFPTEIRENVEKFTVAACLLNQAGQSLNFTFTAYARGDGVKYQNQLSSGGQTLTQSVTCPTADTTPTQHRHQHRHRRQHLH